MHQNYVNRLVKEHCKTIRRLLLSTRSICLFLAMLACCSGTFQQGRAQSGYHEFQKILETVNLYKELMEEGVQQFRIELFREGYYSNPLPDLVTHHKIFSDQQMIMIYDIDQAGDTIRQQKALLDRKGKITSIESHGKVMTLGGYVYESTLRTFVWKKDQLHQYIISHPDSKDTVYQMEITWNERSAPTGCFYYWGNRSFKQNWEYNLQHNIEEVFTYEIQPVVNLWILRSALKFKYKKKRIFSETATTLKGAPETTKYQYDGKGQLIKKKIYGLTFVKYNYNPDGSIDSRYERGVGTFEYQY